MERQLWILDMASMTITNSQITMDSMLNLDALHTSKYLLLAQSVLTTVFVPVYIDTTANTSHSSTPNLCIAHLITSLGTLSKAFSKSTKPKYSFFPLTLKFSSICLTIKMASVVPLPFVNPTAYHLYQSAAEFCIQFHNFHSMFQQFNPSIRSALHWATYSPFPVYIGVTTSDFQSSGIQHTHTHTTILRLSWILSGTTRVSWHQKGKTNLDLLEQEIVSGSGISWAICKSVPRPR